MSAEQPNLDSFPRPDSGRAGSGDEVRPKRKLDDHELRTAIHDVAPPAGLVERMLAAVSVNQAKVDVGTPPDERVALAPQRFWNRRRLVAVLGFATLASTLMVGVGFYPRSSGTSSVLQLETEAAALLNAKSDADWSTNLSATSEQYPWDRWLRHRPQRWKPAKLLGDTGVVYDLDGADDGGAILVVIATRKKYGLPATPPTQIPGSSGQPNHVSWKQPGLVYVLVTDGRLHHPDTYLKPPKFAWAKASPDSLANR